MPKNSVSQQRIICYVPVLHDGYLQFFAAYGDAQMYVLGSSILRARFDYLRKDIRALAPEAVASLLHGLGRETDVLEDSELEAVLKADGQIIMPDDDISHELAAEFKLNNAKFEPVFLRWDRQAVGTNQDVKPDRITQLSSDDPPISVLYKEAGKSTNWWRNVGAALMSKNNVLALAHNGPVPTEYSSAIDGDPRITAKRGEAIDTSIDIHAEARLIGEAAARGEKLAGASLFVTTFPCPTCAKLIAASGIAACYFIEGYASLDGQSILKSSGIEIIKVKTSVARNVHQKLKRYPDR